MSASASLPFYRAYQLFYVVFCAYFMYIFLSAAIWRENDDDKTLKNEMKICYPCFFSDYCCPNDAS